MKTEGSRSSVPVPADSTLSDASRKAQDDGHFKHRKVSVESDYDSESSGYETFDTDTESLKSETGLLYRDIKRSDSSTNSVTSDYVSGTESLFDESEFNSSDEAEELDWLDSDASDYQFSDSQISDDDGSDIEFVADSDQEDDIVLFADSDTETSGYESETSGVNDSAQIPANPKRSDPQPDLNDLLITVGQLPDKKNARKIVIVPFENGRSVTHFSSRKQGAWVERLRMVNLSSPDARDTLGEDASEAKLLEQLDHPNIIKMKGYSARKQESSYQLRMAMEDGGVRLDDALESTRSDHPLPELMNYGKQLMAGLSYLEQKNILHLDIKHGNILADQTTGQLKITDFGLAKPFQEGETSEVGGTDYYTAPEVRKGLPASFAADVYSAGITLMDSLISMNILSMGTLRNRQPDGQIKLMVEDPESLDEPARAMIDLVQVMIDINPLSRPTAQEAHDAMNEFLSSSHRS